MDRCGHALVACALVLFVAACSDSGGAERIGRAPNSTATTSTATTSTTTTSATTDARPGDAPELPFDAPPTSVSSAVAGELAPSQVGASTVPPPPTPDPCDPADVSLWTARVTPSPGVEYVSADAVIRIRNDGDSWCEVDVSRSPFVDPDVEPSVWLEAGAWADLVVGQTLDDCVDPTAILVVPVAVGETIVDVSTSMIARCGWSLTAFYPVDPPGGPCASEQLVTAIVGDSVVVRNEAAPCSLGAVVVDGDARPGGVAELASGDVVAVRVGDSGTCAEPTDDITFESTEVRVAVPVCVVAEPTRPYFAGVDGPLTGYTSGALDVAGALAALAPFRGGRR